MMFSQCAVLLLCATSATARKLWYNTTGTDWNKNALLLGNGKLGVSFFGGVDIDRWVANIDSLWTGGPFLNPGYTGGNPTSPKTGLLAQIRRDILASPKGLSSSDALGSASGDYGSYTYLGYLDVAMQIDPKTATNYQRWLDLETGVGGSSFSIGSTTYERSYFCSYPSNVCVYHLTSSATLPATNITLSNPDRNPAPTKTCTAPSGHLGIRGRAETAATAMLYDSQAAVILNDYTGTTCLPNGALSIPAGTHNRELYVVLAGDTDYSSANGNKAAGYTFRGPDPAAAVAATIAKARAHNWTDLRDAHVKDYQALFGRFTLNISDSRGSAARSLETVVNNYDINTGDPFLEALLFDFSRYILITSTRGSSLPPNLQGRWSNGITGAWSCDYHANINMQMNLWSSEMTGLGYAMDNVFQYMNDTWVPRGTETAQLLYGSRGWTTHNEMNIFGHTAMKQGESQWADFPAAPAWMMQHIWDHYDYTRDANWFRTKAYPMIKGVALFWLDNLQVDSHFNDGSLIAVPCDSPEHTPQDSNQSTFGCSIFQQLIYEVFSNLLKGFAISGDTDTAFKNNVTATLGKLYPGVSVGSWGQLKEWKVEYDVKGDTHRHLSQLYGWYPGYSVSSAHRTDLAITSAVQTLLISRGAGDGADANAGWEKVWRAASWAHLLNATKAHYELRFTIQQNIVGNLLSMYSGKSPPFQIDANYGWGGAVLAMLVRDWDYKVGEWDSVVRRVVLGPAIPAAWGKGSAKGVRLRGGAVVDFGWDATGKVTSVHLAKKGVQGGGQTFVNVNGEVLTPS